MRALVLLLVAMLTLTGSVSAGAAPIAASTAYAANCSVPDCHGECPDKADQSCIDLEQCRVICAAVVVPRELELTDNALASPVGLSASMALPSVMSKPAPPPPRSVSLSQQ